MRPLLISLLLLCALLAVADAGGPCDLSLIKGVDTNTEIDYKADKKLSCKIKTQEIEYHGGRFAELVCLDKPSEQKIEWRLANGNKLTPSVGNTEELNIECKTKVPPATPCVESLIVGLTAEMKYELKKLTCNKPYQKLKYTDGGAKEALEIKCPTTGKWKADDADTGIDITEKIIVTGCDNIPCHKGLITNPDGAALGMTSRNDPLSCPAPKKLKIDSDPKLYDEIKCTPATGWTSQPVKKAQDQFTVSCVDPPAPECTTKPTDGLENNDVNGIHTVTCSPVTKKIKLGEDLYVSLSCTEGGRWMSDGNKDLGKSTNVLDVTCVDLCTATDADVEVASATDGIVFKCKNKEIGKDKNAIRLNDKPVLSHLKCNLANGYTDMFGKKEFGNFAADATVNIACGKSLCTSHNGATCGIFDSRESLTKGYACRDKSEDRQPKLMTDDPNMLNCKTNKFARFYDAVDKKFHDYPLICSAEGFYKYDDKSKVEVSDPSKVLCLEHTCATCPKLLKGTTDGTELGTNDKDKFTEGTPIKCATAKCMSPGGSVTTNLWSVKRAGSTTNEEYAGDVTCSSEGDANGVASKKWLIDGETEIIEGSCIDSVASCVSAVKLTTTCDGAWTGCIPVTLSDDAPVKCTAPNLMFYMQKGDYGFLGGATEIKCDKDWGVWKVTKSGGGGELRRGGTVICANQNPAPTTTTLAPTTTTPFVKACDVCPTTETMLMKCDDCSNRADHIKRKNNDEMCEAFPEEYSHATTLKTDKGTVDKLYCNKTIKKWTTKDGQEVGKFAAFVAAPVDEETSLLIIVGGAAGGVLILIIIFAVIFKVCIFRKKRPVDKDEETKKKMLEAKKKKKLGDNDDILDQVSVDVPSELKL